jgi:spermidine synthase
MHRCKANAASLNGGLFCTTLATLALEILDGRLLSVVTWYHLSFLAVSLAMLGMAAGAVFVFLAGDEYRGDRAPATLARWALIFAILLPISHLINLSVPLPTLRGFQVMQIVPLAVSTIVLAVPFFASGVIVTMALTRVGGSIGRLYSWDLLGAAAGCASVVGLLEILNLSSVALVAGAVSAVGAWCFCRFAASVPVPAGRLMSLPISGGRLSAVLAVVLLGAAVLNGSGHRGLSVQFSKDKTLPSADDIQRAAWNSHSFVLVQKTIEAPYFYWGAGARAPSDRVSQAWMVIDGEAATPITGWSGRRADLDWVQHDVTAAPYAIRGGDIAIIGVGGGRDILSALAAGNRRVTGIEINQILLDTLRHTYRDFAGIARQDGVSLVHDEARSFLSRAAGRYDVIQMSLIDTWAATGAGAFTLSENGLYTTEAWRVFLDGLRPGGVFSVSRWFSPTRQSETTRLLALGIAAILQRGGDPRAQLVLLARGPVATLMMSNQPFQDADRERLLARARDEEFTVLASPWTAPASDRFARAVRSRSVAELTDAVFDADFDFTPPSDNRPYFFNQLRLRSFAKTSGLPRDGLAWGNLSATKTLVALFVISTLLVAAIVVGPLVAAGASARAIPKFGAALTYFSAIGAGFMLIQIPFLQRFSVFLGHPVYTFAIVLLSMILFAGIGSFFSDRIPVGGRSPVRWLPVAIAAMIAIDAMLLPYIVSMGTMWPIAGRSLMVLAFTAPLSLMLGCCFPVGMRLVGQLTDVGTAWMWGVNGAAGVLASVAAVGVSMWVGISANLVLAAVCYLVLTFPMRTLLRSAR